MTVLGTGTASGFPFRVQPLSNVTPFTYRDGITYTELLHALVRYVDTTLYGEFTEEITRIIADFNQGIAGAEQTVINTRAEWDAAYAAFLGDIEERVQAINNRVGPEGIQRETLTAHKVLSVDPAWPDRHIIRVQYTQDAVGGWTVTFAPEITGQIDVNGTPGAVTEFDLVPMGNGAWRAIPAVEGVDEAEIVAIVQANAEGKLPASDAEHYLAGDRAWKPLTAEAVGLGSVNNTADLDKPVSRPVRDELAKRLGYVTTRAELETALLNGGNVWVSPYVTIPLETPVVCSRPTKLHGGNFSMSVNATVGIRIAASNVTIDGARFTGPGTGGTFKDGFYFIHADGHYSTSWYDNIKIENCSMSGGLGDGIRLSHCSNSNVSNNHIWDYLYCGIMILTGKGITIDGNHVHDAVMKTPVVNVYGIAITDMRNSVSGRSRECTISNNRVENIPWEGIDSHGGTKLTITGNIITNCTRGIALVVGNETRNLAVTETTVTGNVVDGMGSSRAGIGLYGAVGISADAIITGNIVIGHTDPIYTNRYDTAKTIVSGNNVPWVNWTNINTADGWIPHPSLPPQFKVDGRTTYFRGMVQPPGGVKQSLVGAIGSAYSGARDTEFINYAKGANPNATGDCQFAINANGQIVAMYGQGSDTYFYPLMGSITR